MYKCKYCGKEFEKSTQLGAHVISCKLNPNYEYINNKRQIAKIVDRKDYNLICPICGKTYTINMSLHDFENKHYRKTCSKTCAHKLTIQNCNNELRKNKISNNKNLRSSDLHKKRLYTCEYCGKQFYRTKYIKSYKYCSDECMIINRHNKLSKLAKDNKLGGLNINTTHKRYKRGYYKGIWCDSSWELAFVLYCIDNNIPIERNYTYKIYTHNNVKYKFYPDFIVNGKLVEIKGFITDKNKSKIEQIHDVEFIFRDGIEKYLKYAIEKYGHNFYDILYE